MLKSNILHMENRSKFFTMHWHSIDVARFTTECLNSGRDYTEFLMESDVMDIEIEIQQKSGFSIQTINLMYKPMVIYSDLLLHVEGPYMKYDLCLVFVDGDCSVMIIKDNSPKGSSHIIKYPFQEIEEHYPDSYMVDQIRIHVFSESQSVQKYLYF